MRGRVSRLRITLRAAAVLAGIAWFAPAHAGTANPDLLALKLSPELRDKVLAGGRDEIARVIVQFNGVPSERDRVRVRDAGGADGRDLPLVSGFLAEIPVGAIAELAADPRVRRVVPDRRVRVAMDVAAPSAGVAPLRAHGGPTGRGIGVAVIDSGVHPHEDLPGLAAFVDFVQPRAPVSADPFGHGTHVAGIIAASPRSSSAGGEVGGVAPGAHIVSLRVLDREGEGWASDTIEAIRWAVENRAAWNLRVLNLSLGHPVREPAAMDPLAEACAEAWRAGLVVITSAGNLGGSGNGTITSPGHDPTLLTVGALDDRNTPEPGDDEVAPFSSRGPALFDLTVKPDVVAPGARIVSLRSPLSSMDVSHPEARVLLPGSLWKGALEARHFELSGSSMAAAVVSGVVALMIEADPSLSPDAVKARLMTTSRRLERASIFERGAGAVDVGAALEPSWHVASAPSAPIRESDGDVVVGDAAWSGDRVWPLEAIYGDPAFWDEDVIWRNGLLADPCVTGAGLIWQGATIAGAGLIWQGATVSDEGLIWQGATVSDEGLIWQGLGVSDEGLIWQGLSSDAACTSPAGLIWQGAAVFQEGLIWQGSKSR